ncbi:hypothetical protein SLS58_002838 [Diplodia intermedia]|uniref:Heterokaryon incompatibility domain-containing protein n=1 Tax=Diplodia intermedia TaxID=856260 RepID=A0ABR3TXX3_9PEZI
MGADLPSDTRYATLSHCWGGKLPLKLTKSTLARYTNGIPADDLTPKFRQVVQVTRKLGLDYLWIDSLCILQDSDDDWAHESSRMGRVYEGATINIVAASASDSNGPLFSNTVQRDTAQQGFRDYFITMPNVLDNPFLCCDEGIWQNDVSTSPVARRAWVLQELLLAPRILYFCKNQMFWECSELQACEQWPDGLPKRISAAERTIRLPRADETEIIEADTGTARFTNPFFPKPENSGITPRSHSLTVRGMLKSIRSSSLRPDAVLPESKRIGKPELKSSNSDSKEVHHRDRRNAVASGNMAEENEKDLRYLWPEIIRRYSRADLSFPEEDKLTAISAVAKRLYPPETHNYLAGFWRDQMPSCLAWKTIGFAQRPRRYQAPSWSWASVNGPVRISTSGAYNPHLTARILEARTQGLSKDPTGRVSAGSIRVQTMLLKVECRNPRESIVRIPNMEKSFIWQSWKYQLAIENLRRT